MNKKILILMILSVMLLSSCMVNREQIKNSIIEANSNIKSYEAQMTMSTYTKMTVFGETVESEMLIGSMNEVDLENKKMHSVSSMESELLGEVETETYMIDDKIYSKTLGQWITMDFDSSVWEQNDQMNATMDYLMTGEIKILKDEEVEGALCYVINVEPDLKELADSMSNEALDLEDVDLEELFSEYSITFWVDKSNYRIKKTSVSYTIEQEDFLMSADMEITYFLINEPVVIEVPAEALEAGSLEDQMEDLFGEMEDLDLEDYELPVEEEEVVVEIETTIEDCEEKETLAERDGCVFNLAVDKNDLEMCKEFEWEYSYIGAIMCGKDIDENIGITTQQITDFCESMPNIGIEPCFSGFAKSRKEPGLCEYVDSFDFLHEDCLEQAS